MRVKGKITANCTNCRYVKYYDTDGIRFERRGVFRLEIIYK